MIHWSINKGGKRGMSMRMSVPATWARCWLDMLEALKYIYICFDMYATRCAIMCYADALLLLLLYV